VIPRMTSISFCVPAAERSRVARTVAGGGHHVAEVVQPTVKALLVGTLGRR